MRMIRLMLHRINVGEDDDATTGDGVFRLILLESHDDEDDDMGDGEFEGE